MSLRSKKESFQHEYQNKKLVANVLVEDLLKSDPEMLTLLAMSYIHDYDIIDKDWDDQISNLDHFLETFKFYECEPWKNGVHNGDCVKASAACSRCLFENLYKDVLNAKSTFKEWNGEDDFRKLSALFVLEMDRGVIENTTFHLNMGYDKSSDRWNTLTCPQVWDKLPERQQSGYRLVKNMLGDREQDMSCWDSSEVWETLSEDQRSYYLNRAQIVHHRMLTQ